MNTCVVFHFLHGWLSGEGEVDDGMGVKLVSPRGALLRIFGLPPELQSFGPLEGGWWLDLFFVAVFVAMDAFQHSFLGLQSFCFSFGFGRGRGFLLRLWCHLRGKGFRLISYVEPTSRSWEKFLVMMYVWYLWAWTWFLSIFVSVLLRDIFILLKYSWFTMLCYFLVYSNTYTFQLYILFHYGLLQDIFFLLQCSFRKIFHWSIVDLQCCVNFCCIAKWRSYTYTYIHTHKYIYSFSYSFPLWFITG